MPIDTQGTMVLPIVPMRPMVEEYYKNKNLSDEVIASHLHGLVDKFFKAIETKDESAIRELTEPTFGQKLVDNLKHTPKLEYTPATGKGKAFLVDKLFIKGMNLDRRKNDTNFDYYYVQRMEKFGLRTFVHKFNTGDFHYYLMRDFKQSHFAKTSDEQFKKDDPDGYYHFHRKTQNDLKAYKNDMFNKEY